MISISMKHVQLTKPLFVFLKVTLDQWKRKVSAEDIAKVGRIEIRPFIGPLENTPLHYQELQRFHCES